MRVRRGLLFWGLLLIPLGAIPLIVRANGVEPGRLIDLWRLWPLIVIGIGIGILFSRTRFGIVGLAIVALTLGTMGGAVLASGSAWFGAIGSCGFETPDHTLDQSGGLDGPADVSLDLNCGTLDLQTDASSGWTFHANYRGPAPTIEAASDHLAIRTPDASQRQDWTVTVPAAALRSLDLTTNAATTTADLGPAAIDTLTGTVNAGDIRIQAGSASIRSVDVTLNAGRLRLALGEGSTGGSLSVNAGAIDLCVPPDAGLRLTVQDQLTFATNLSSSGLAQDGTVWTRAGTSGQTIDLSVEGNAATFNLDPNGGC
jgi:hypothetical protein